MKTVAFQTSSFRHLLWVPLVVAACGGIESSSSGSGQRQKSTYWGNTGTPSPPSGYQYAVVVDVTTNMAAYYRHGQEVDRFNVVTAKPGKTTPEGTFPVHTIQYCPRWFPGGVQDANGQPCNPLNPMGEYAMYIQNDLQYAFHAPNQQRAAMMGFPVEQRRLSNGCVSALPDRVQRVFNDIMPYYSPKGRSGQFSSLVAQQRSMAGVRDELTGVPLGETPIVVVIGKYGHLQAHGNNGSSWNPDPNPYPGNAWYPGNIEDWYKGGSGNASDWYKGGSGGGGGIGSYCTLGGNPGSCQSSCPGLVWFQAKPECHGGLRCCVRFN